MGTCFPSWTASASSSTADLPKLLPTAPSRLASGGGDDGQRFRRRTRCRSGLVSGAAGGFVVQRFRRRAAGGFGGQRAPAADGLASDARRAAVGLTGRRRFRSGRAGGAVILAPILHVRLPSLVLDHSIYLFRLFRLHLSTSSTRRTRELRRSGSVASGDIDQRRAASVAMRVASVIGGVFVVSG